MDRRVLFTLAAVVAAVLTTVAAATTVSRVLGKISTDLYLTAKTVFLHDGLPALALGLTLIGVAVVLPVRFRPLAIILMILAPVATMVLGMALFG